MMATVPHVTSGLGLRKFQADGFLLTRVYKLPEDGTEVTKHVGVVKYRTFMYVCNLCLDFSYINKYEASLRGERLQNVIYSVRNVRPICRLLSQVFGEIENIPNYGMS